MGVREFRLFTSLMRSLLVCGRSEGVGGNEGEEETRTFDDDGGLSGEGTDTPAAVSSPGVGHPEPTNPGNPTQHNSKAIRPKHQTSPR
eukprot:XP_001704659.1 Hypothetical protein GL50803_24062 [Giardia lamblia ATCC 50803]